MKQRQIGQHLKGLYYQGKHERVQGETGKGVVLEMGSPGGGGMTGEPVWAGKTSVGSKSDLPHCSLPPPSNFRQPEPRNRS